MTYPVVGTIRLPHDPKFTDIAKVMKAARKARQPNSRDSIGLEHAMALSGFSRRPAITAGWDRLVLADGFPSSDWLPEPRVASVIPIVEASEEDLVIRTITVPFDAVGEYGEIRPGAPVQVFAQYAGEMLHYTDIDSMTALDVDLDVTDHEVTTTVKYQVVERNDPNWIIGSKLYDTEAEALKVAQAQLREAPWSRELLAVRPVVVNAEGSTRPHLATVGVRSVGSVRVRVRGYLQNPAKQPIIGWLIAFGDGSAAPHTDLDQP